MATMEAPPPQPQPLAVVKQLNFGDETHPELKPVGGAQNFQEELKLAEEQPSYETFKEACRKIALVTEERFATIRSCAATAAASGTGEGALRSMRDQFRSLKGSFVSLDTKEAFIDALMAGRPDGTESTLLTQAQSATSQSADELRKSKKRKEEITEEIKEAIGLLCGEYQDFDNVKNELESCLARLNESMSAYDKAFEDYTHYSTKAKLPKEKLRQSISEAKALEAEKEQRKARQDSELQETEAEIQALQERIHAKRAELKEYKKTSESKSDDVKGSEERVKEQKQWLKSQIEVVTKISGITILDVSETELHLSLKTEPDPSLFESLKLKDCKALEEDLETVEHEICVGIDSEMQTISTLRVTPNDIPYEDVLQNLKDSEYVSALVHAINARVASYKVREAYMNHFNAAGLGVQVETADNLEISCKKSYGNGTTINVCMPRDWPQSSSKLVLQTNDNQLNGLVDEFHASDVADSSLTVAFNYLDTKLNL
jgi:chromosome segregation ATPase